MLIDCDTCAARGPACGDCVVTVLLGAPPAAAGDGADERGGVELDGAERAAIAVLAGSGLVPPLRLVEGRPEANVARSGDVRDPGSDPGGTAVPGDRHDPGTGRRRAAG